MTAETTGKKQRGKPFAKGCSGNPSGRPVGSRHRLTVLAEKLMADDAEGVVRKVIKAAKDGDITAARLILDRIAPPRKGSPVSFPLLPVETAADVTNALGAILLSVAKGELTPDEATAVAGLIEMQRKAIETAEIEARLTEIEQRIEKNEPRA